MMHKALFALVAITACADESVPPGTDDGSGSDDGGDGGGGSDDDGGGGGDGGDTSAADLEQDYDDVAASLGGHLVGGELRVMADAIDMSYGRMPAGFTVVSTPELFVLDGVRDGLTIRYEIHCRDVADVLAPCNGLQDHSHVEVSYAGTVAAASGTTERVERSADWTVRDIMRPRPRIGGDGRDAFSVAFATGSYTFAVEDTLERVRFDSTPVSPVEGAIQLRVNVQRTRPTSDPADRDFDVDVEIVFDGSDRAAITLDSARTYYLTLSTGVVVKA